MATPETPSAAWTEDLVRFLQSQPGIAAVRVNPTDRKVSVATLGPVDTAQLAEHIAEVLRAIEHKLAEGGKGTVAPAGFVVKRSGETTTVERPTCVTAPGFWRWTDYNLAPEEDDHDHGHGDEWRLLSVLAATCGVAGLAAFTAGRIGAAGWLVTTL